MVLETEADGCGPQGIRCEITGLGPQLNVRETGEKMIRFLRRSVFLPLLLVQLLIILLVPPNLQWKSA